VILGQILIDGPPRSSPVAAVVDDEHPGGRQPRIKVHNILIYRFISIRVKP
jgi:hypothetical protein